ncbi:MAG: hypothetical protein ACREEM_39610 [Blastocatellia bacterium]
MNALLDWFGEVTPLACAAPQASPPQNVALLARLPGGAPVSVSVSYDSRLPEARMLIVGSEHTIETDGFSYLRSDLDEANQQWNAQAI